MKTNNGKKSVAFLFGLLWLLLATGDASTATFVIPNPVVSFIGQEFFETGGKQWTRYRYSVDNLTEYPNELFAAAPELPPCGANTKSSRAWVDIFDAQGKRLNGFCALGNNDGLGKLWFALETNVVPPSWIYVEIHDRKTGTKYKSGLAETTQ